MPDLTPYPPVVLQGVLRMLIANILLLVAMVALLTVVPLIPGLITGRLLRTELARDPRGVAEI